MDVIVTGGSGFIGNHLIRLILAQTALTVLNVDKLTYAGAFFSSQDFQDDSRYAFYHGDICDSELMESLLDLHKPKLVFHLAAESHVDQSIESPQAFVRSNVVGTGSLLQACLGYYRSDTCMPEFRFIHVSTDEVYRSLSAGAPKFKEDSPYQPRSPYAATKASSDHLARAWYHTYELPVIVTHCSNNFGPFQHPEKLIPKVILNCLFGNPIPVYGTGENIRDWVFVEDHCRALLKISTHGEIGATYNIGGEQEHSNLSIIKRLCRIIDDKFGTTDSTKENLIQFVADRPGHDFRYAVDTSKIRNELSWRPQADFDSSLTETVSWYADHASFISGLRGEK